MVFRQLSTISSGCRHFLFTPLYFVIILSTSVVDRKMGVKIHEQGVWISVFGCKRGNNYRACL